MDGEPVMIQEELARLMHEAIVAAQQAGDLPPLRRATGHGHPY
jgi:hypothetical protein